MGTFVPLDGSGRPAKGGGGFVPLINYSVEADENYKREKAKALKERAPVGRSMEDSDNALVRTIGHLSGVGNALTGQPVLPVLDELNAGVRAGGNAVANLFRGKDKQVSSEAIYRGQLDADRELKAQQRKDFPVSSIAGSILSGLPAAPEAVGAKVVAEAPGLLARGGRYVGNVAKGSATGAAYGGAYGAADAAPGHRLEGATEGAEVGAATGGLLTGVAPVAGKILKTGAGAVKDVLRAARKPSAEAERELGTATAVKILQRKGLTADSAAERAAEFAPGLQPVAAELGGSDVERLAGANARRGGKTGDVAMALKEERREGAPERILDYAKDELGVDTAAAKGDIEEQVKLGRQIADPLYADVRANPAGIWNDTLQELSQRPAISSAMRAVETSGRNAGRQGTGMAMGTIDVPAKPVGPEDLSFAATGAPSEMPVPRGPAEAPTRGESALTSLRNTGNGIDLASKGEAQQAGLRLRAQKGGNDLHDMAIHLWETGHTPRLLSETEMETLLDSGAARELFAKEPDPAAQQRFEARKAAEEFNARGGNPDDLPHPEDYGGHMPEERPLTEPARTHAPTGESWDQVLSALDDLVERDDFGKVVRHGPKGRANRDLDTATRDLRAALIGHAGETGPAGNVIREEVAGAVPGLREARQASGDYRSIQGAAERMKGRLTRGTYRDLEEVWNSAKTASEKDAMRGAMANEIYELVQNNTLKAGRVSTRRAQAKLELLFGQGEGKAFVNRVRQEAKLAASANRMAPTGGSPTYGLGEAGKEGDAAGAMTMGDWARVGGHFLKGRPDLGVADALATPLRKAYRYSQTAGMSEAARDAMGEVLFMGPDELVPLLRQFESLPPEVQRVVHGRAVTLGLIGGNAAGQSSSGERQ